MCYGDAHGLVGGRPRAATEPQPQSGAREGGRGIRGERGSEVARLTPSGGRQSGLARLIAERGASIPHGDLIANLGPRHRVQRKSTAAVLAEQREDASEHRCHARVPGHVGVREADRRGARVSCAAARAGSLVNMDVERAPRRRSRARLPAPGRTSRRLGAGKPERHRAGSDGRHRAGDRARPRSDRASIAGCHPPRDRAEHQPRPWCRSVARPATDDRGTVLHRRASGRGAGGRPRRSSSG